MSSLLDDSGLSKVRLVVRSLKDGQSKLDFHLIQLSRSMDGIQAG